MKRVICHIYGWQNRSSEKVGNYLPLAVEYSIINIEGVLPIGGCPLNHVVKK